MLDYLLTVEEVMITNPTNIGIVYPILKFTNKNAELETAAKCPANVKPVFDKNSLSVHSDVPAILVLNRIYMTFASSFWLLSDCFSALVHWFHLEFSGHIFLQYRRPVKVL